MLSASTRHTFANLLLRYALPVGWFALLTGMFWIGDRRLYHTLYYATLAAPVLLLLALQPRHWSLLQRITLLRLFLLFATYMLLSLSWADSSDALLSMVKRPLYIALLFAATVVLGQSQPVRLALATEWAARVAVLSAVISIAIYLYRAEGGRLSGYGALYNPLLSSHVFGFFAVYWLCRWYQHPSPCNWIALLGLLPLGLLLLLTGSRTPLLAIAACIGWLAVVRWRPRVWPLLGLAVLIGLAWQWLQPAEGLLNRGLSYRPAIWAEVLRQLQGHLTFGLGLTHPQVFPVAGLPQALADTHNLELGVLFEGGLVGLGLWLAMYGHALVYAWRQRQSNDVLTASTLVIFGLVAGLTEGSAFFSRPKEHWFLLWIPLALLAATQSRSAALRQSGNPG